MDPEIKANWLAALRSGEYTQAEGQLHDGGNKYCCLGVLCVVGELEWQRYDVLDLDGKPYLSFLPPLFARTIFKEALYPHYLDEGVNSPPVAVSSSDFADAEKVKTSLERYGELIVQDDAAWYARSVNLTSLNDAGATFKEIANIIEREFITQRLEFNGSS